MDIRKYNREAWDRSVDEGNEFTIPVSSEIIQAARLGDWRICLTQMLPVPRDWFPENLEGLDILCLASGGGQQGPVLAAAGANVTILDNSPKQLAQDRMVADRDGLELRTIEGDMADLSMFQKESFDIIVNPVSNVFAPHVLPIWYECYHVLRYGGVLMTGFMNPVYYLFDLPLLEDKGVLKVKYKLPYSDLTSTTEEERQQYLEKGWPLEFSHSLDEQIGGQLKVGFVLTGFFEDHDPRSEIREYMPVYIATRAVKIKDSFSSFKV
ncbi:MAG: class I SAM-dependent methyltransferase [Chloroflexi bacterium]|nr:MAG: class I SAM-dependent methyltransferase [Chloroflexota bacterium]